MASLDTHAGPKDTNTDTSGSQTAVANIEEKPLSGLPSGKDDVGPTLNGDSPVRTVHGIKACTTYAEALMGDSGTLIDRFPTPVVLCLQCHYFKRPILLS